MNVQLTPNLIYLWKLNPKWPPDELLQGERWTVRFQHSPTPSVRSGWWATATEEASRLSGWDVGEARHRHGGGAWHMTRQITPLSFRFVCQLPCASKPSGAQTDSPPSPGFHVLGGGPTLFHPFVQQTCLECPLSARRCTRHQMTAREGHSGPQAVCRLFGETN